MTNQDCIAHYTPLGTPYKCIFAQYVLPFIKTPLFIAQVCHAPQQPSCLLSSSLAPLRLRSVSDAVAVAAQNLYDSYQLGHILA